MTKEGLGMAEGFWKVRVCPPGSIIHLASQTEPVVEMDQHGRVKNVIITPLTDNDYGDTAGFIDWPAVVAITWRRSGGAGLDVFHSGANPALGVCRINESAEVKV
jgi:hypothetical protein